MSLKVQRLQPTWVNNNCATTQHKQKPASWPGLARRSQTRADHPLPAPYWRTEAILVFRPQQRQETATSTTFPSKADVRCRSEDRPPSASHLHFPERRPVVVCPTTPTPPPQRVGSSLRFLEWHRDRRGGNDTPTCGWVLSPKWNIEAGLIEVESSVFTRLGPPVRGAKHKQFDVFADNCAGVCLHRAAEWNWVSVPVVELGGNVLSMVRTKNNQHYFDLKEPSVWTRHGWKCVPRSFLERVLGKWTQKCKKNSANEFQSLALVNKEILL